MALGGPSTSSFEDENMGRRSLGGCGLQGLNGRALCTICLDLARFASVYRWLLTRHIVGLVGIHVAMFDTCSEWRCLGVIGRDRIATNTMKSHNQTIPGLFLNFL